MGKTRISYVPYVSFSFFFFFFFFFFSFFVSFFFCVRARARYFFSFFFLDLLFFRGYQYLFTSNVFKKYRRFVSPIVFASSLACARLRALYMNY